MLAAAGKPRALRELLEAVRYSSAIDRREMLDARDDDGRTALMVAANVGAFECVELLREAGADVGAKDERGRDARYYAAAKVAAPGARSQAARAEEKKVVDLLDGKLDEESEEEEQEEDVPDDGLTSTQRNKLKKKLLREQENKGAAAAEAQKKAASGGDNGGDEGTEGDAAEEDAPKEPPAEPKWEEIAQALASGKKEIKCLRAGDVEDDEGVPAGQCDAALWRCTSANRVELKVHKPSRSRGPAPARTAIASPHATTPAHTHTARLTKPHRAHAPHSAASLAMAVRWRASPRSPASPRSCSQEMRSQEFQPPSVSSRRSRRSSARPTASRRCRTR